MNRLQLQRVLDSLPLEDGDEFRVKFKLPQEMQNDDSLLRAHKEQWVDYFYKENHCLVQSLSSQNAVKLRKAAYLFPNTSGQEFANWCTMFSAIPKEFVEDVAKDEPDRFSLEPYRYPEIFEWRDKIERLHWIASEVDLRNDKGDLNKLSLAERYMLEHVLGILNVADVMIVDQIGEVLDKHAKVMEFQAYLFSVGNQEHTHNQSYSRQTTAVIEPERRKKIFNSVSTMKTIGKMADWVRFWTLVEHASADLFTALAFIEGAMFSGFFAAIQYFSEKNVLEGITKLNEFIQRDENIHSLFWIFMVNMVLAKSPDYDVVSKIAQETARLSGLFFEEALVVSQKQSRLISLAKSIGISTNSDHDNRIGINANLMTQYCQFVCDTILSKFSHEPIFGVENPLDYMDKQSLNKTAKTNFFEGRVSAYQELADPDALIFAINLSPVGQDQ